MRVNSSIKLMETLISADLRMVCKTDKVHLNIRIEIIRKGVFKIINQTGKVYLKGPMVKNKKEIGKMANKTA